MTAFGIIITGLFVAATTVPFTVELAARRHNAWRLLTLNLVILSVFMTLYCDRFGDAGTIAAVAIIVGFMTPAAFYGRQMNTKLDTQTPLDVRS